MYCGVCHCVCVCVHMYKFVHIWGGGGVQMLNFLNVDILFFDVGCF